MRTKRTAYLAACSIPAVTAAILLGLTHRELLASPPAVPIPTPEERPPAPTAPSPSPSAQVTEVSEAGAYRGSLKSSPEAPVAPPLNAEEARAQLQRALQVENDGPNDFRIGVVKFDRVRRTVTIPATVNMDTGMIEYALVTETGKVHEALFATAAKPEQIHLACLLLGMPKEKQAEGNPPAAKDVKIKVMWDTNGPLAEHDLSQMVVTTDDPNALDGAPPLPVGSWNYVGSMIDGGGFVATREGSVISLIQDPQALVDNPRESAKRDDIHFPNKSLVPAKGSAVRIVLTIPEPAKKP